MKNHYQNYSEPKQYKTLPDSYKNVWEDPECFIPKKMHRTFNQQMFYNFIHRECFNSCINKTNVSNQPNKTEIFCYENCRNKHLSSLGIFKHAILTKRKWNGFLDFVNLREYQKDPDEMGELIPTDIFLRGHIRIVRSMKEHVHLSGGLNDLFGIKEPKQINIFEYYLLRPGTSFLPKPTKPEEKGSYEHYKELSEKYGAVISEKLNQVNVKDWKGIPGDDLAEDEE